MAQADPLAAVRETFRLECAELLDVAQDHLQGLRDTPSRDEHLNGVFRAVHTIKGGAGAFAMERISARAHNLETTLDQLRAQTGTHRAARLPGLVDALDALSRDIDLEFSGGGQQATTTFTPSADDLNAGREPRLFLAKLMAQTGVTRDCQTSSVPALEDLSLTTISLEWEIKYGPELTDILSKIAEEFGMSNAIEFAPPPPGLQVPVATDLPTLRVGLHRVDELMNLVGELVINQSMLLEQLNEMNLPGHAIIHRHIEDYQRLTRDLQSSVMQIRAQPLKSTFQRMAMVAREAAAAEGKDIDIILEGTDVEVDKTVVESLVEPLTHVVRNAVDHGIEDAQTRLKAGKTTKGSLTISAQHVSGRVLIDVTDDGGGLPLDRLRKKALEKGVRIPRDDADAAHLIFVPGLTTAECVGDLSGRGIGMDAVKSTIERLGGLVSVRSETGAGTRLRLSLPLTLALMDAMIVRAEGHLLALPLAAIVETRMISSDEFVVLSGGNLALRTTTGIAITQNAAELYGGAPADPPSVALMISRGGASTYALLVDEILEQRQIVIKGMSGPFLDNPAIFGATILGDGRIALILDTDQLGPDPETTHKEITAA